MTYFDITFTYIGDCCWYMNPEVPNKASTEIVENYWYHLHSVKYTFLSQSNIFVIRNN